MRLWKRLLGTALCLCAAVCLMSVSASAAEHSHPICGKTHTDIGDHTETCEKVTWTAWNGTDEISYDAGTNTAYVYLSDNAAPSSIPLRAVQGRGRERRRGHEYPELCGRDDRQRVRHPRDAVGLRQRTCDRHRAGRRNDPRTQGYDHPCADGDTDDALLYRVCEVTGRDERERTHGN